LDKKAVAAVASVILATTSQGDTADRARTENEGPDDGRDDESPETAVK
jgi:hypothetical protein